MTDTKEPKIVISGRTIGPSAPPYIIAELSANHNGSLENALRLIDIAVEAGASAVKLQTYRPDTITLESDSDEFQITEGLWAGHTLYDLYENAHTPWEWHKPLFEHAAKRGITIFSSPFDKTAVDFLEDLNTPAYKIASFEAVDLPLIEYVAQTGKPMIISTGMADKEEIGEAIETARSGGCSQLIVLHCVSGYPAPASDYNLVTIRDIADSFSVLTGLSDHNIDNTIAVSAIGQGAVAIEKHITLDRSLGGPDDSFSLEPSEFKDLCEKTNLAWQALGKVDYGRKSSERANAKFRRSLYFVEDVTKGQTIEAHMVRSVRPGYGLAPKYLKDVIGKTANQNIARNSAVRREMYD